MTLTIEPIGPELGQENTEPISLSELNELAALQTRVDRKYIVDRSLLDAFLDSLSPDARVLDIDGRRSFGYESVYFDTPELTLYRAAAHRRRHRFKVRSRTYVHSGLCMLEVKTKGGRGETAKHRLEYCESERDRLTSSGCKFVEATVGQHRAIEALAPVLTTNYHRTTFVDPHTRTRFTCDQNLACTDWRGQTACLDDAVIVETKSAHSPSPTDHWLWEHGIRPKRISKYCTGLAALHPDLPANRWHRTLQTHW